MFLSPCSVSTSASLLQRLSAARIPLSVSQVSSHRHHRKHRYYDRSKSSTLSNKFMHGRDDNTNFQLEGMSDKMYPIKLNWERPVRVGRVAPEAKGSGDIKPFPEVDLSRPVMSLVNSPSLAEAPEEVQRVLSLGYARNRDVVAAAKDDAVAAVQRHRLDHESLEVAIAELTLSIRNMQKQLSIQTKPSAGLKHKCKILVDRRRVLLGRLREEDYKKFEWLLEELELAFKPRPFVWERVERKKMLTRLTDLWCEEFKESKRVEYQRTLEEEQPKYLREKAEKLKFIQKEEQELGLPSSVSEDDISECLRRANEIETKLAEQETATAGKRDVGEETEKYLIYEKEVEKPKHQFKA